MVVNLNGSQTNQPAAHLPHSDSWSRPKYTPGSSGPLLWSSHAELGTLVCSWRLVVDRNHGFWLLWYLLSGAHRISHDNQLNLYDRHQ